MEGPFIILYAEDDVVLARLLKMQLERDGFSKVHVVDALREALVLAATNEFDIILLDLGLRDSSGMATLGVMVEKVAKIPVIVITGDASDEARAEAMSMGAAGFFTKPIDAGGEDMDDLKHMIAWRVTNARKRKEMMAQETEGLDSALGKLGTHRSDLEATIEDSKSTLRLLESNGSTRGR